MRMTIPGLSAERGYLMFKKDFFEKNILSLLPKILVIVKGIFTGVTISAIILIAANLYSAFTTGTYDIVIIIYSIYSMCGCSILLSITSCIDIYEYLKLKKKV